MVRCAPEELLAQFGTRDQIPFPAMPWGTYTVWVRSGGALLATLQDRVITAVDELVDPVASARVGPMVVRPGVLRAQWPRLDLDGVVIELPPTGSSPGKDTRFVSPTDSVDREPRGAHPKARGGTSPRGSAADGTCLGPRARQAVGADQQP